MPLITAKLFLIKEEEIVNLLSIAQLTWIILAPIGIIGILIVIIYLVTKSHQKNKYREIYYKTIRSIADEQDYYLLNNFIFRIDHGRTAVIDHLLIGDKYFYVISSLYYDGNLSGKEFDSSLILTTKNNGKNYTDNPLFQTKTLIQKLSLVTGIDQSMMIGIVVLNDACNHDVIHERRPDGEEIPFEEKIYFLCNNNKLKKLIKKIERRNVGNINADQLDRAVKSLDKLNRKKR